MKNIIIILIVAITISCSQSELVEDGFIESKHQLTDKSFIDNVVSKYKTADGDTLERDYSVIDHRVVVAFDNKYGEIVENRKYSVSHELWSNLIIGEEIIIDDDFKLIK